jgi:hypothetical protein
MDNKLNLADVSKRCCIVGCDHPYVARGFCDKHYRFWLGNRTDRAYTRLYLADKNGIKEFLKKNVTVDDNGCWIWQRLRNSSGYGFKRIENKSYLAHRLSAYVFNNFDLQSSLFICHTCDNPSCINPSHLFVGSQSENMLDMHRKGRHPTLYGSKQKLAKLNEEKVQFIRKRLREGEKQSVLAAEYGVDRSTISSVWIGRQWKHVYST